MRPQNEQGKIVNLLSKRKKHKKMNENQTNSMESLKKADWELDFYSRPIIEPSGKNI